MRNLFIYMFKVAPKRSVMEVSLVLGSRDPDLKATVTTGSSRGADISFLRRNSRSRVSRKGGSSKVGHESDQTASILMTIQDFAVPEVTVVLSALRYFPV